MTLLPKFVFGFSCTAQSQNYTEGFFPLKCIVISPKRKDLKPAILVVIHFPAWSNSISCETRAASNILFRTILMI